MRFFWEKGSQAKQPIQFKTDDDSMNIWPSDKKLKRELPIRKREVMSEQLPKIKRATNERNIINYHFFITLFNENKGVRLIERFCCADIM